MLTGNQVKELKDIAKEESNAWNFVERVTEFFKKDYPTLDPKPRLATPHDSKMVKIYSELLKEWEEHKKRYDEELDDIKALNSQVDEFIQTTLEEWSGVNKLPLDRAIKVKRLVWERGRSKGYPAYYRELEDLVDLFN